MPKSKNRPNHKQKLQARRNRINETTNIKQKQLKNWIQQMQESIKAQQIPAEAEAPAIIDANAATPPVETVEEISQDTSLGASGELK